MSNDAEFSILRREALLQKLKYSVWREDIDCRPLQRSSHFILIGTIDGVLWNYAFDKYELCLSEFVHTIKSLAKVLDPENTLDSYLPPYQSRESNRVNMVEKIAEVALARYVKTRRLKLATRYKVQAAQLGTIMVEADQIVESDQSICFNLGGQTVLKIAHHLFKSYEICPQSPGDREDTQAGCNFEPKAQKAPPLKSDTTTVWTTSPKMGDTVAYNHPGSADWRYPPSQSPALVQMVFGDGTVRLYIIGPKGQHTEEGLTQGDGPCQWNFLPTVR